MVGSIQANNSVRDMRQVVVPRQVGLKILVEESLLPIAAVTPPILPSQEYLGSR